MSVETRGVRVEAAEVQVPLFEKSGCNRRRERREQVVRHVEYCRFPRVCADQRPRLGFSRDVSPSGLCIRTEMEEPVGALLRVMLHGVDGQLEQEAIARVARTAPTKTGAHWLGLALVAGAGERAIRIRYLRRPAEPVEVTS